MPCDQIEILSGISLFKGKINVKRLIEIIAERFGLDSNWNFINKTIDIPSIGWINIATGEYALDQNRITIEQITQAYIDDVLQGIAKKYGWKIANKGKQYKIYKVGGKK